MISYSEDQVTALVTDAGTLKRGRELAAPAKWSSLGRTATAAWGACAGSGATPYLTGIDLTEPAFKCSCPSRVFPCKHGAALLLLLARQPELLPPAVPPTWLAEWLDKRQLKKQEQAEKSTPTPPPTIQVHAADQPAAPDKAQLKREAQRLARMAAGADELETWLLDLMRQGLADLPARPRSFWETAAARLVDNQLPGLAAVLRELAAYPDAGPDWASRLLGRLGELYLLLRAWANRDALPPAAQQEIAQQVGITLKKDELLADPAALTVADSWLVLGQHTWPEDRLMARRSWLHGQHSGRRALVLEFAFGNQPFATALLPQVRYAGELVFYPGLLPLRAVASTGLVRQPDAPAERPNSRTLPAMLDAYATALARQPWLREFPATVWAVVGHSPTGAWQLHDPESGAALALRLPDEQRGWQLLALGGGQPLALFGEWDGREFRVLSYWLAPAAKAPTLLPVPALVSNSLPQTDLPSPPATNPWPVLLRVALLGTQQAPDMLPTLEVGDTAADASREQQLLLRVGTLALMQKAGFQLLASALPPSASAETQPLLGPMGQRLLRLLLSRLPYRPLLSQYLAEVAQHRRVVPPSLLTEVLSWLQGQPSAAPFVAEALGERGRWLATQNADWLFAVDAAAKHAPTEADWHTGPTPRRRLYLENLLRTDPTRAAQLLAEALPQENTATQVALLGALDALPLASPLPADLAAGLTPLLASRAKEVRQTAARWLARVADSPLLPRLWARAESLLHVKRKLPGTARLTVTLPAAWSAEWQRDGIEQKTADYPGGEKAGQLGQLLAMVPPSRWATAWGGSATEAVALAAASDWAAVLLPAWLRAAHLHHDADFALALLLHEAGALSLPPKSRLIVEASGVLTPSQKVTWLLAALPPSATTLPASSAWAHWLPLAEHPWPPALRQRALPLLRAALRQPPSWAPEQTERDAAVRSLLYSLGSSTDPDLLPLLTAELGDPAELQPRFADEVAQVLELRALRPQLAASLLEEAGS